MTYKEALQKVLIRQSLTRAETREVFAQLMNGQLSPVQIAAVLVALRVKGEAVDEIAGAAEAMRQAAIAVHPGLPLVVDSCGTGGDGQGSFNVSTAAAFVVAGTGIPVAKHGNRSVSSHCGSADLLEALGVPVETGPELAERCLREVGIVFLFAPLYHPATKYATPVRRELGVRTIFNLLGPLTNPANPAVQLIGVYDPLWLRPMAEVLRELGTQNAVIVHGQGADEIVLCGPTQVVELIRGEIHIDEWWPRDFGVLEQRDERLLGGLPAHNAEIMMKILNGGASPYREAVCMNAAALLRAAARSAPSAPHDISLKDAYQLATQAIDRKAALGKLTALRDLLAGAAHA